MAHRRIGAALQVGDAANIGAANALGLQCLQVAELAVAQFDRIPALVPPSTHRHRYFGVLAPNSPLRAAVTAMAQGAPAPSTAAQAGSASTPLNTPAPTLLLWGDAVTPDPVPPKRPDRCLWAVVIARIYSVFPLLCPLCGGQMRIFAFISHSADIRQILGHIEEGCEPPHIAPAHGPLLSCGRTVMREMVCAAQSSRERTNALCSLGQVLTVVTGVRPLPVSWVVIFPSFWFITVKFHFHYLVRIA